MNTMKLSDIHLDPARFQRRTRAFDENHVRKLVAGWNITRCAALIVWADANDGKTYLLSGHHRYEAARRVGCEAVPVRMFEGAEAEAIQIAIEDNYGRLEYSPMELSRLIAEYRENGMNTKQIADKTGCFETYIRDCGYLIHCSNMVQERIEARTLDYKFGALLGKAAHDYAGFEPEAQNEFLQVCEGQKMSLTRLSEILRRFAPRAVQGQLFGLADILKRESARRADVSAKLKRLQRMIKDSEEMIADGIGNGEAQKGLNAWREVERRLLWELRRIDTLAETEKDIGEYRRNNRRGK